MKIYNFGSLNVDYVYRVPHFLQPGETLSSESRSVFPGGKGLNQSVAAARAGAQVVHGGAVGEGGDFLLEILSEAGVQTDRILRRNEPNGHTFIQVDPTGQNCILLFPGTNRSLTRRYLEEYLADAAPGDILLLQNETNCLQEALQLAEEKQLSVALNPSPFSEELRNIPVSAVKWWFCNEIEAEALFGSSDPTTVRERFLAVAQGSTLVLTLGEQGSVLISSQEMLTQPIYPVQAVDTTAAGDTFTGYFLSAVAGGSSAQEALSLAAKASAIAVSRAGAAVSIPTLQEVLASPLTEEES